MPLYGHELTEEIDPFSGGLGWAVKLNKGEFVGREPLVLRKESPPLARIGLVLDGKRIARQGARVILGEREIGLVTSGTFSPTLQASIAMALVAPDSRAVGSATSVDVRGHRESARVVKLPFYKRPDPAPAAN